MSVHGMERRGAVCKERRRRPLLNAPDHLVLNILSDTPSITVVKAPESCGTGAMACRIAMPLP